MRVPLLLCFKFLTVDTHQRIMPASVCSFLPQQQARTPKMLLVEIIDTLGKIILRSYVERVMNLSSPILIWSIKIISLFKGLHFLMINITMEQIARANLPIIHIILRGWKKATES